ncbi:DUF4290 domain-containing protein [Fulvivirga lutea]|uniref:DUF4290 domain-containing protein n=1 Tax=Fulvivirga lutea TaxID=2810512 RepID=A0A975A0N9_9BACT|nr:DUF4290 domain-containing protein [Fulvivirga lutea]QSE97001.1 DUF4290 domain-containing protein [Fulvivirga lutea]
MNYNTSLEPIVLKEYGRNVQMLVEYLKTVKDKEKRTEQAHALVDLMRQITPSVKETTETNQKLWDDLYIMADLEIEIDGPYPKPEAEMINKKPQRMGYSTNHIRYKHYGKNIELLIKEAIKKEDPQEKEEAIIYIGKLMKSFYGSWNKEVIDDAVILENIQTISGGKLDIDLSKVREDNLFEKLYKAKTRKSYEDRERESNSRGGGGGRGRNNRKGGSSRRRRN